MSRRLPSPIAVATAAWSRRSSYPEPTIDDYIQRTKQTVTAWSGMNGLQGGDPRIFALAAQRVRMRLGGAWVVGDSPEADIGGAAAMGLPSVWLHRCRRGLARQQRAVPTYAGFPFCGPP